MSEQEDAIVIQSVKRRGFFKADKIRSSVVFTLNDEQICDNVEWMVEGFGRLCGQLFDGEVATHEDNAQEVIKELHETIRTIQSRYEELQCGDAKPEPVSNERLIRMRQLCKLIEEISEFIIYPSIDEACDVRIVATSMLEAYDYLVSFGTVKAKLAADEERGHLHSGNGYVP